MFRKNLNSQKYLQLQSKVNFLLEGTFFISHIDPDIARRIELTETIRITDLIDEVIQENESYNLFQFEKSLIPENFLIPLYKRLISIYSERDNGQDENITRKLNEYHRRIKELEKRILIEEVEKLAKQEFSFKNRSVNNFMKTDWSEVYIDSNPLYNNIKNEELALNKLVNTVNSISMQDHLTEAEQKKLLLILYKKQNALYSYALGKDLSFDSRKHFEESLQLCQKNIEAIRGDENRCVVS